MSHGFHLSSVQVLYFTHCLVPTSVIWHTRPCHRAWAPTRKHEQVTLLGQYSTNTLFRSATCASWSPTPASNLQLFTQLRFLAYDLWYTANTNAASTQTDSRGKKTCAETAGEKGQIWVLIHLQRKQEVLVCSGEDGHAFGWEAAWL